MAIFKINNNEKLNNTNLTSWPEWGIPPRASSSGPSIRIINNIKNTRPLSINNDINLNIIKTHYTVYQSTPVSLKERHNIRLPSDTTAIKQEKYNFYADKFRPGFPIVNNKILCPQKISTVFQNGSAHWSQSSSYPNGISFIQVSEYAKLATQDCGCTFVDFTGKYELNWSIEDGPRLLSSSNPNITLGTFNYYINNDYFEIFLYPNAVSNSDSYIHIRYRVPMRFRYAYGDWVFWESLILDGTLSETEFVKVVNCCQSNTPGPLAQPFLEN